MKTQRKQLVLSVIALILCFTTLLGTTYAWFTDSVTSKSNIVHSGSLDIAMYWNTELASASSNTWKNVEVEENKAIFDSDQWEPGYTEVRYVMIKNNGDLAFKYVLDIVPMGTVTKLAEVIDVYFLNPAVEITDRTQLQRPVGTLAEVIAGKVAAKGELTNLGDNEIVTIALKMRETAGNEYQGLSIGSEFSIRLSATQLAYEGDVFDNQYDKEAGFETYKGTYSANSAVETVNGETATATSMSDSDGKVKAEVPAGVKLNEGTTSMSLTVTSMSDSAPNITVEEGEVASTLDVHMEGVAPDNTVPITVVLSGYLAKNLNAGNYTMYHIENGTNVEMRLLAEGETPAHNTYTYDPATGDVVMYLASFSLFTTKAVTVPVWQGGVDYSWYNPDATRLTISNADQLAAFARIVGDMAYTSGGYEIFPQDSFAGKIVKLACDVNLGWGDDETWNGYSLNEKDLVDIRDANGKIVKTVVPYFYPIGYYNSERTFEKSGKAVTSGFYSFEGVFDGCGHTISNFYQNTWGMKGDDEYYALEEQRYRDGMGLFGRVYGGTVKNLTVDSFSSDGEYTTTGTIAAYADFGATFENITITNCNPRVYNIGNGGIVGCVGWYTKGVTDTPVTFRGVTVDNSNKISALWGSWDVACGGIVGQYYPTSGQTSAGKPKNAGIFFDNCHVAAQIDVYNDVCANYQYYAYRYAGILLGSVRENVTINGHEYPNMNGITASNCTVHFGTWNDYYYCELVDNTTASYTHDYQMSRLVEIKAIDGNTITYLDGTTGTIPTSGRANYVIVDYTKGHGTENATCYHFKNGEVWTHEMGGIQEGIDEDGDGVDDLREDKQHIYREFNNLVTGYGWGVTSKGVNDMEGVKILDEKLAEHDKITAVEKFVGKNVTSVDCMPVKLGDLFSAMAQDDVSISIDSVYANIKSTDGVTAIFTRDANDWTKSTLKFSGAGTVEVTIQDYYYCTPTTITITVTDHPNTDMFIGRVTADRDPNGVGYELWACTQCKEAVKIVANHEDGHHFTNNNCNCGAIASETEKIVVGYHDFSKYSSTTLDLSHDEHLQKIVATGKWEITATRPHYQSGSDLQPAISKNVDENAKIVQMMQGKIMKNGLPQTISNVYVSFKLSYTSVNMPNIDKAVLFSFRTTEMSGTSYQHNEIQLFAQVKDGVMSIAGDADKASLKALTAGKEYTVTVVINPETKAYQILLSGGEYSNTPYQLKTGTLAYALSNFNTAVFRSNDFSLVDDVDGYNDANYTNSSTDAAYAEFFEKTARPALNNMGAIYVDDIEFAYETKAGITGSGASICTHNWTATEIAGETDLYRYTCSECGYYFNGVKGDVVKVFDFASINFNTPASQTHENLAITTSNNNGHFAEQDKEKLNINYDQKYFSNGKLDITTNTEGEKRFYIVGSSVFAEYDLNRSFIDLMSGNLNGNKVDAVEITFDLQYTGDITKLKSGLGLLFYQSGVTGATNSMAWLNFDKNDATSGALYFRDGAADQKAIINEGQTYTVTLRMELNPTIEGKYVSSFVVRDASGNKISAGQLEENTSFAPFYQIVIGRPDYQVTDFHIYFDNLNVTYETIVVN